MRKREEIEKEFSPTATLEGAVGFFLVGIGGAGMSALARMLNTRGYRVRGTDSTPSPETRRLGSEGIEVHIGHSGERIAADDVLVLTDAIDLNASPEVAKAREMGIPIFRRSQALGWLLKGHKVIAVTGTHGKTTTTGMTGAGLIAAGLDPLVVVGANIPEWGGPVREGKGVWAVVEACEAYDSFHDIDPDIVVLTNLEPDHLDYHGSWENLKASVERFVDRAGLDGVLVYCSEDEGASAVADGFQGKRIPYWLPDEEAAREQNTPGRHNALNALGAIAACEAVALWPGCVVGEDALKGVQAFCGAERRLQVLHDGDVVVIDDYAHHPTEVAASVSALKERYRGRRLVVVFQPHLYSRTAENIDGFAEALSGADVVVL
ncbi:MAG TPA: Mur ligase domain-containing protein, partial [Fimbriimonas sp.]